MKPLYRTDWQTIAAGVITTICFLVIFCWRMSPVILHNLSLWWNK